MPFLKRTEKQVIRIRTVTTDLKYFYHVKELSMNIADHSDGRLYMHNIALFHQQLFRFGAYCFDHGVRKELFLVQARYTFVQINTG